MEMSNRMEWGYIDPVVTMAAVGGKTSPGILITTVSRVGEKKNRRGRKTAELNRNQNTDLGRD